MMECTFRDRTGLGGREVAGLSSDAHLWVSPRPGTESQLPEIRIGTDLCAIADVAAALAHFGQRYLDRVYTANEIDECMNRAAVAEAFAGRFAAKEAVLKALRPHDFWPDWREIEVRRDPAGWSDVALFGKAAQLADETNVVAISLSITHEREYAQATAIATIGSRRRSES
jgi:holo-[acyl-carrier protein] synthase